MKHAIVITALCILLAGCGGIIGNGLESSGHDGATTTQVPDNGSDPYAGVFELTSRELVTEEDRFYFRGRVELDFPRKQVTFQRVQMCGYTADGQLLTNSSVGNLTAPRDSGEFEISATTIPHYVTVDHPTLTEYKNITATTLVWNDGIYQTEYANLSALQSDFEYPRRNAIGRCM